MADVRTTVVKDVPGKFAHLDDLIDYIDGMLARIDDGKAPDGEEGGVGAEAQALRQGSRAGLHNLKLQLKALNGDG